MKLVVELNPYLSFNDLMVDSISGIMIGLKGASLDAATNLDIWEINEINKSNKLLFLNIERIFTDAELQKLEEDIKQIKPDQIDYYVYSDLGVYELLVKLGLKHKTLYKSPTQVTNEKDLMFHLENNSKVFISSEITSDEILPYTKYQNICVDLFGQNIIFYSRRPLLSNYFKYRKSKQTKDDGLYTIIEETRSDSLIIKENDYYTIIYEPKYHYLDIPLNLFNDECFGFVRSINLKENSKYLIEAVIKYLSVNDTLNFVKDLCAHKIELYKGAYDNKTTLLKEGGPNE